MHATRRPETIAADDELDRQVADAVPIVGKGLGLLYGLLAFGHVVMIPGAPGQILALVAALTAGCMGIITHRTVGRSVDPTRSHHLAVGMLGAVAINSGLHLALTGAPEQTTNLMLLVVGAGAFLTSLRWMAAVCLMAGATWLVSGPLLWPAAAWLHFGIGLAMATFLAVMVFTVRRRALIRLVHARHALRLQATTDQLTGALNRRGFQDAAAMARDTAAQAGRLVGLLAIDLDRFKQVNDTFGHAAGDAMLQSTADVLRGAVRSTDLVARLGGDEFAVLLTSGDHPEIVADRLERLLRGWNASRDPATRVAMSVGWAVIHPDESMDTALGRADAGMYDAKAAQRASAA